jgi:hypothetical protein
MSEELEIKLRRTGGVGPNAKWDWSLVDAQGKAKWDWSLVDAQGKVVKKGSAMGEEAKAFATARKAREKLARG